MTEREKFLYEVIEAIAQSNAPIIFKGAMITKLLLKGSINKLERETKDIDYDWIGEKVFRREKDVVDYDWAVTCPLPLGDG